MQTKIVLVPRGLLHTAACLLYADIKARQAKGDENPSSLDMALQCALELVDLALDLQEGDYVELHIS